MTELAEDGYAIIPGVLSKEECEYLLNELATWPIGRSRAGVRHLMRCPAVSFIAHDKRLQTLTETALMKPAIPYRATLFAKTPESDWLVAWHQDTALPLEKKIASTEWGPWSTKSGVMYAHAPAWALDKIVTLRIQLDPYTQGDGSLRVIPGSHRNGILSDSEIHRFTQHEPLTQCLVPQGGVLVMKPLIIHASSKSKRNSPRRVLHVEYAPASGISETVRLAIA